MNSIGPLVVVFLLSSLEVQFLVGPSFQLSVLTRIVSISTCVSDGEVSLRSTAVPFFVSDHAW